MRAPATMKIRHRSEIATDEFGAVIQAVDIALNGTDYLIQRVTEKHGQWEDLVAPALARGDKILAAPVEVATYIDKRTKHLDGGGYGTTREQFAMFDDAVKASTETDVREKMIDGLIAVHASRMEVKIRHPKPPAR